MPVPVPVVVLKTSRSPFAHAPLWVARSLGRMGVPTYVVDGAPRSPVARSRYVRGMERWNFAAHPEAASVQHLLDVGRHIGDRPVLIPTDDAGAILLADHADRLRSAYRFPEPPAGLTRALANKRDLFYLCKSVGISTPETVFPSSHDDVLQWVEKATFPVVVKRIDGQLVPWSRAGQSVFIAHTARELLKYYDLVEGADRPNLMLQDFIPGGPESNWLFNGYFNADSDCLMGSAGQKIRQYPPYAGFTSLGVCRPNPGIEAAARDLLKRVGYRGIVDVDFRYDARDRTYRMLDVNPRLGATFRLFLSANGLDVARAMYLDLTGASVSAASARTGRRWMVEAYDPLAALAYLRDGILTFGDWIRSFKNVEETAWLAWDDPVPFAVMCATAPLKRAHTLLARCKAGRSLAGAEPWQPRRDQAHQ